MYPSAQELAIARAPKELTLGAALHHPFTQAQLHDLKALYQAVPKDLRGLFRLVVEYGEPVGLKLQPDHSIAAFNGLLREYNSIPNVEPLPMRELLHAPSTRHLVLRGEDFATILADAVQKTTPPADMHSVEDLVMHEGYPSRRSYAAEGRALLGTYTLSAATHLGLPPVEKQMVQKLAAHVPPDLQGSFAVQVVSNGEKPRIDAFGIAPNVVAHQTAHEVMPSMTQTAGGTYNPGLAGIPLHGSVFNLQRDQLVALAQHLPTAGRVLS